MEDRLVRWYEHIAEVFKDLNQSASEELDADSINQENLVYPDLDDIIEDLKSELGGHFEDVIVALMRPPAEYLCKELHNCMEGMGTDEGTLVEILCTRTKREVADIVETYERLYNRPLAEHMCSETSGDFRRLLTLIVTSAHQGARNEEGGTDAARAAEAAQQLYDAGEAKWGTDEEIFNKILAHESFEQLRLVFDAYKQLSGRTIEQAIKAELDGELRDALSAIVETCQNAAAWFATRLRAAMQGLGTDDRTLIRIIVSRSEIDLGDIRDEYERLYDKTLVSEVKRMRGAMQGAGTDDAALVRIVTSRAEIDLGSIKEEYERLFDKTLESDLQQNETSGDYKRALVALLNPPQ
ncbi:unnamed protein product [Plutella xylostella]|uniref:Annexin n=1 Tax=Plutella xylostella TaxID=51655 RepID=A0A8S4DK02_PLUXY|nr:unnamed protein product [Plutella xylostella]